MNEQIPLPKIPLGRPTDREKSKKKRNYSLTDKGHDGFLAVSQSLGLNSRSQLAEAIGRKEVIVSLPDTPEALTREIPNYPRLRSVLNAPVSRFRSTLSMARILAYQLGITDSEENFYQSEEVVIEAVRIAFIIMALEEFLHPEQYLLDVSSAMQWLVFRIMIAKADLEAQTPSPKFDEFEKFYKQEKFPNGSIEIPLKQIYNAFYQLKQNFALHYQVVYMRMMQRLSFPKVCAILRIRGIDLAEKQGFLYIREGVEALRRAWHSMRDANITELIIDSDDPAFSSMMQPLMEQAQCFYTVTKQKKINGDDASSKNQRKTWELFLLKAMMTPGLSLWLGEVLHARGHEFDDLSKTNVKQYNHHQQKPMDEIAESLDDDVRNYLDDFKSRLRFGGVKREELNRTLHKMIKDVWQIDLPEVYFSEKRKHLEAYYWYNVQCMRDDSTSQEISGLEK